MYNEQQSTCLSSSWWFDKYLSTTPFFFSSSFHKPSTHTTESQFSEPLFSEPQFSEILDLMNKLQLLFFIFHSLSRIDLVNSLDLVNKRGLTTMFTKSSLGCILVHAYIFAASWCKLRVHTFLVNFLSVIV